MMKPSTFNGTYAEFYQRVIKPKHDAITPEMRSANMASHTFSVFDGAYRCIECEIGHWNGWQTAC